MQKKLDVSDVETHISVSRTNAKRTFTGYRFTCSSGVGVTELCAGICKGKPHGLANSNLNQLHEDTNKRVKSTERRRCVNGELDKEEHRGHTQRSDVLVAGGRYISCRHGRGGALKLKLGHSRETCRLSNGIIIREAQEKQKEFRPCLLFLLRKQMHYFVGHFILHSNWIDIDVYQLYESSGHCRARWLIRKGSAESNQ
ncbi:hypothetical protein CBL_11065 [Carabus blaptoides fortunei]